MSTVFCILSLSRKSQVIAVKKWQNCIPDKIIRCWFIEFPSFFTVSDGQLFIKCSNFHFTFHCTASIQALHCTSFIRRVCLLPCFLVSIAHVPTVLCLLAAPHWVWLIVCCLTTDPMVPQVMSSPDVIRPEPVRPVPAPSARPTTPDTTRRGSSHGISHLPRPITTPRENATPRSALNLPLFPDVFV